jgi:hypothetical protein
MKTRSSTWLFVWDLFAKSEFADLYRSNAAANDDGDRERTLQGNKVSSSETITEFCPFAQ